MKHKNKIILLVLILVNCGAGAQSMHPGIWKATSRFNLSGLPLPPSEDEGCVTAEQAKDPKATIEKGLKKNGCELTKWTMKKGKLNASLKCKNKDLDAEGSLSGTFSAKSYELEGEAEGTYKNAIPTSAKLTLKGRWIKACAP